MSEETQEQEQQVGRRQRQPRANGAAQATPKKRGRKKKTEATKKEPILLDLFLPRDRVVNVALPGDFVPDEIESVVEQLNAFVAFRTAQERARG